MASADQGFQLQSTLSAASASVISYVPHHPVTCTSKLQYEEDGTFRCEHTAVGPEDVRTQQCLHHSIAILLLELTREKY